jgi:hypothetical protein
VIYILVIYFEKDNPVIEAYLRSYDIEQRLKSCGGSFDPTIFDVFIEGIRTNDDTKRTVQFVVNNHRCTVTRTPLL